MDYIVRATAADHQIRAFAATTKDIVESGRVYHNTSPGGDGSTWKTVDSRSNDECDDERGKGSSDTSDSVFRDRSED